jgi:coenzyme F420-0:L-glutamate ligase/coenzyme F420-1:gamma-L-glutamate ligase
MADRMGEPPASELRLIAVPEFPLVSPGDDLAQLTARALSRAQLQLRSGDVLVFAQKVVSKAEGRRIDLATVTPGPQALELARTVEKDPRLVELVLRESRRVVRSRKDVLIVEHRLGFVMANAGIDQSNVAPEISGEFALLLPEDPDASARHLREQLAVLTGYAPGVVINDSFGRPWRLGTVGVAIGCAGVPPVLDLRGRRDLFGRSLRVTVVAHADEVAAAASVVMGQAAEARPVVLVRGLPTTTASEPAACLIRPAQEDLFR